MDRYNFKEVEVNGKNIGQIKNYSKQIDKNEKFYCHEMFPYPSRKIHIGHVRNYTMVMFFEVQKAKGFNVLHPMGWDAFGMPAKMLQEKTN